MVLLLAYSGRMNEYIDVRGVWPVYVRGMVTVVLFDMPRDITLLEVQMNAGGFYKLAR